MSRLDRKSGRFSADFETNEIHTSMADWQHPNGTTIDYYHFNAANSVMNDIYDEADGTGRAYDVFPNMPVLQVIREEGRNENRPEGFYYNDTLHVTAAFDQIRRAGLSRLDVEHEKWLNDRIVYDNRVFRITNIEIRGQIRNRDLVVGIDATQVKPDELIDDAQFASFYHDPNE